MSKYPEVTVGAIIFNQHEEILLVRTHKWKNHYCIPGGHIEYGETAKDAVKREVLEETGLEVEDVQFHIVMDCIFAPNFHKEKHFIFIDFTCRAKEGEVILNDEAEEYLWASHNLLETLPIESYTKKAINHYYSESDQKYFMGQES